MAETQVHFKHDGAIILGRDPDFGFDPVEHYEAQEAAKAEAFQHVIDTENNNEAHAPELQLIEGYFAGKRLQIDPLRVVSPSTVEKAYAAAGINLSQKHIEAEGRNVYGRTYVVDREEYKPFFGKDLILGIGLHEAAHSLGGKPKTLVVTRQAERINSQGDPQLVTRLGKAAYIGGFGKADLRSEDFDAMAGEFWVEAFADLTRVRGLRELGRSNHMSGLPKQVDYDDGMLVEVLATNNTQPLVSPHNGAIALPAEYAMGARTRMPTMRNAVGVSACNFAAFGLELLDKHLAGLYDTMLAGQQNPKAQADFIRRIESIRPGLYRELGTLPYTVKGFSSGLLKIADVLGISGDAVTG